MSRKKERKIDLNDLTPEEACKLRLRKKSESMIRCWKGDGVSFQQKNPGESEEF